MNKISKTIDIFVCKFCGREWDLSESAIECERKCSLFTERKLKYKEGDIVRTIHGNFSIGRLFKTDLVITGIKKNLNRRKIFYICNYFDNTSETGIGKKHSDIIEDDIFCKVDTIANWKRKYIKAHKLYEEMREKYPECDVDIFPEDSVIFKIIVKENKDHRIIGMNKISKTPVIRYDSYCPNCGCTSALYGKCPNCGCTDLKFPNYE